MRMNRRIGAGGLSSEKLHLGFTLADEGRIKGLAHYLEVPYSRLLRDLARDKRRALNDAGKKPPLRPKPDGEHFTGPKLDGAERVYRNIRVTPDERDEIVALAQYLGMAYSEMMVMLADAKREELVRAGKKPRLTAPDSEMTESIGRRTPRR
jgi:hypothetical protein